MKQLLPHRSYPKEIHMANSNKNLARMQSQRVAAIQSKLEQAIERLHKLDRSLAVGAIEYSVMLLRHLAIKLKRSSRDGKH